MMRFVKTGELALRWGAVAAVLVGLQSCAAAPDEVAAPFSVGPAATETAYLEQGWSAERRGRFYFTPQGSRMAPYAWFMALEAVVGGRLFAEPGNLARYGLIQSDARHRLNPGGLPIGFAVEADPEAPGGRQVGLTCAACHTATATVKGRRVRIDGAPAHFDFDSFYADFAAAVAATKASSSRFEAFAARVEGAPRPERSAFDAWAETIAAEAALRKPGLPSGYGRVDALTQIVNALAARDQGIPENRLAPAAPTSYPPIWLTPELEAVQWNPIAANPMGRNGGQVLGVFGETNLKGPKERLFASSMRLADLHALESWARELRPPVWDEALMGPIDRALAAKGEALFAENCAGCHNMKPYRRTDAAENAFGRRFIRIGRVDFRKVGTDPAYVEALVGRRIRTNAATAAAFGGRRVVPGPEFFAMTVGAAVERAMAEAKPSKSERLAMIGYRLKREADGSLSPYRPPSLTDLKASPLAGVWATGPYLHNGSVPTVYELLSPPSERRTAFWTGGRALDLTRLGYESEAAPGRYRFDTTLRGNGNMGHAYPAGGLTPDARWAVIEYLKTQ